MREILFRGPETYEGHQWCAVCSMIYKAQVMEAAQELMQFAMRADGAEPFWMEMEDIARKAGIRSPMEAACTSPSSMLGGAIMPLCWSHVTGLTIRNGAVVPAGPGDLAQMTGQPVPTLGRR